MYRALQRPSGLNIKSTYIGSKYATTTMSGTSMASPHTAGMLAYLLSLYPSKDFNPSLSDDMVPPAMTLFAPASISDVYGAVHAALPSWITAMLPAPALVEDVAPTPKEPISITPKQLKKALLGLSTPDMLDDLGDEFTPNLLIFNNATA